MGPSVNFLTREVIFLKFEKLPRSVLHAHLSCMPTAVL